MSASLAPTTAPTAAAGRWVCPFCPLLCDSVGIRLGGAGAALELQGTECHRAAPALARFSRTPPAVAPSIDGQACGLDAAIAAAARMLAASHQPLFGGLGTDVAGARALYPLACATGAICDPAAGEALMQTVRALQDRGGFTSTFAELRNRADLIVFFGAPGPNGADFIRRAGLGEGLVPARHLACLGHEPAPALAGLPNTGSETIAWQGDAFASAAMLAALVAGKKVREASPELAALAARLQAAAYSVIVWDAAGLPAQGGLIIEMLQRAVATLNQRTRSAGFPLGGSVSAATVNQVFSWLSGLPLRSRAGALGLEHEPYCFDAKRLLADGSVDALLWISSFGPDFPVPSATLPRIVLGHPEMAPPAGGKDIVFIPVSTPGVGSAGHLFRTDGVVLMSLLPIPGYIETLPTAAEVLGRITLALKAQMAGGSP